MREFHEHWRALCEAHQEGLYVQLKAACDAYFWLPARHEHRGTGGIFFDDLEDSPKFSAEMVSCWLAPGCQKTGGQVAGHAVYLTVLCLKGAIAAL